MAGRVVVGQVQQGVVDHGHAERGRHRLVLLVGHHQRHARPVSPGEYRSLCPATSHLEPPRGPAVDEPFGHRLGRAGAVVVDGQPDHAADLVGQRDRHRVGAVVAVVADLGDQRLLADRHAAAVGRHHQRQARPWPRGR